MFYLSSVQKADEASKFKIQWNKENDNIFRMRSIKHAFSDIRSDLELDQFDHINQMIAMSVIKTCSPKR